MTPTRPDPQEIERAIKALFRPQDVIELRVPTDSGTRSGYYGVLDKLAQDIGKQNGSNVYYTLNPCKGSLLARAANRIRDKAKVTTSDKDIERRRWLLVDLDPERPAGISSTDEEHQAAIERARDVRYVMGEEGWPAPIVADSGNGGHLAYAIDLPNDDESKKLLEGVLKALAARFNTATVKIDVTVFNAARITKAYGSVACKGDNTPERPHRLSRLIEIPTAREFVSREQLEALAASVQPSPAVDKNTTQPSHPRSAFSVEAWISEHGLAVRAPVTYEGGRKWVLLECPFNAEHKAPDAAIFESAGGKAGFHCLHNSCAGYHWQELRDHIEGPRKKHRASARPMPAQVDLNALPASIEMLNALSIFAGHIRFKAVRRRGSMIILTTTDDDEIIFPTTAELGSFRSARALIADGANVYLPAPPHGQNRSAWDAAASMILRLAAANAITVEPALKEEVRELLRLMWRGGGQAQANDSAGFIRFMRTLLSSKRDPRGEIPTPPTVFIADQSAWVHVPTLRLWLSTPQFTNRLYPLADVRNGLLLLGFVYCENVTRRGAGDSESLCLWRGPIDVLVDAESNDEQTD